MSRKANVRPKKRVGEIFRFLHSLISLGHKLKEHPSEKLGNFVLVAPMLRDSVSAVLLHCDDVTTSLSHGWVAQKSTVFTSLAAQPSLG